MKAPLSSACPELTFKENNKTLCARFIFQSQRTVSALETALQALQSEHDSLRLQQQKVEAKPRRRTHKPADESCLTKSKFVFVSYQPSQADVVVEDKERVLTELQKKVVSLERRLQGNLSQDEHLQELLQEVNHSFTLS